MAEHRVGPLPPGVRSIGDYFFLALAAGFAATAFLAAGFFAAAAFFLAGIVIHLRSALWVRKTHPAASWLVWPWAFMGASVRRMSQDFNSEFTAHEFEHTTDS